MAYWANRILFGNKKLSKTKINPYGDEVTDFHE